MPLALAPAADCGTDDHYISACLALAQEKLGQFSSISEIAAQERLVNRYPRLEILEAPRRVLILEDGDSAARLSRAQAAVLRGEVLSSTPPPGKAPACCWAPSIFSISPGS